MIIKLLLAAMFAAPGAAVAADAPSGTVVSTSVFAATNRSLSVRCARNQFGAEGFLSDTTLRADMETFSAEEALDLINYAACRSLQGETSACSSFTGLGHMFTGGAATCRVLEAEDRFVFLTLRGGDALAACKRSRELAGKRGPSVDKGCAAYIQAARSSNAAASCAVLTREKLVGPNESCEDLLISWSGSPQACDRIKVEGARSSCLGRAALVAGLRDPAKCASSPSCQALVSKSPRACDDLRARFSGTLCARVAKDRAAIQKDLAQAQEQLRPSPLQIKEKNTRMVAAQSAAVAAEKVKVEAAAVKAKAESLASQEKVAKMAAAQTTKTAESAAVVRTKAEAEAKKDAKAKADIAKKDKPQFKKGVPMQTVPVEAKEIMKALEEGRPIPAPKPQPKKIPKEEAAPADE